MVADVSAELATAAALAPLGSDAARVPMPLALRARVQHAGRELRADPLHVSIAGQTLDGRMTLNTAQPRPRVDAALTSKSIDLTKLGPVASTSQARRARAGRPGRRLGRGSPTPRCRSPPFPVSTSTSSSGPRACDFRRRRRCPPCAPGSRRPPGRVALDDVEFGVAGGRVRGRANLVLAAGAPPRVDVVLRCEVALGRGARCRHGRWRPLPWRPGRSLGEPGDGRRDAEAARRVCERQRAARRLRHDARGRHGGGARSQRPHDDAQAADTEGIRGSGAGGAMHGGAPAAAPGRRVDRSLDRGRDPGSGGRGKRRDQPGRRRP